MTWFLIAIIAPFLWSIVNHVDKYLLSKHSTDSSVGSLMIFSTFAGMIVAVIAPFFTNSLFIGLGNISLLILSGMLCALAIMLYLYALETDETSVVVPFMQLIPVTGYIYAYFFLGEVLSFRQIIACSIIIFGAMILSLEFGEESGVKIRKKVAILMICNALIYSLYEVLFKMVAVTAGFVESLFWEHVGLLIFGLILYVGFKKYRTDFHQILAHKGKRVQILGLNISSEVLTLVGNVATNYALLLAPVAMVLVVSGYQPVFAIIIGVLLTVFYPKIAQEKLGFKHMAHKLVAIGIILAGSYMLFV